MEEVTYINRTMGYVGKLWLCRAAIREANEEGDRVYPLLKETPNA